MQKNKKFGFTLAEVLITIGIIGVVAAMTIPTLIKNAHKKAYESGLKKTYSTVVNACNDMLNNENVDSLINTDFYRSLQSQNDTNEIARTYFKTIKDGNFTSISRKHYASDNEMSIEDSFRLMMADGSIIYADGTSIDNGIVFHVDLDGENNGQNLVGRDIFSIPIDNHCDYVNITGNAHCNDDEGENSEMGMRCFSDVITNDWQITYY